ncbi:3'-5' exonuclease [Halalkalicoccus sp. GCM10025322]|uniref:3'-5' exonuclease n=1 Tax=Halalkalicoccus TaxID=332246 RepID=UPI002F961B8D
MNITEGTEHAETSADTDRAKVVRVVGCPSGGKTTRLLDLVEQHAADGKAPEDMLYLTFTRSGKTEVAERLTTTLDCDEERAEGRASTFHGAACSACYRTGVIDEGEQIIPLGSDTHIAFCEQVGFSYDPDYRDPLIETRDDDTAGDPGSQLFALADWLRYTRNPPEACTKAPSAVPMPAPYNQTVRLLREWDTFKRSAYGRPRFEHADYVDAAIDGGLVPKVDVLFIDEFQDLCPQEYALYDTWIRGRNRVETAYIAGDANQSVYGFRAGTPRYFIGTSRDDEIEQLVSYRCPAEIVSVARGVLEAHPDTDPNGFTAARDGGTVERVRLQTPRELTDRLWSDIITHDPNDDGHRVFLLTRTNKQARSVASALDNCGVPHSYFGRNESNQPWGDGLALVYRGTEAIGREQEIQYKPAEIKRAVQERITASSEIETYDELNALDPTKIVKRLDLYWSERKRLLGALSAPNWCNPNHVSVGTMHSAKGLEAPCVYLFDTMPHSVYESYIDGTNADEEHRVYYVGASRASETLRVVSDYWVGGEPFPPFADGLPAADGEVLHR